MVTVPAATPVNIPEVGAMVAVPVAELDHVPPEVVLVKVMEAQTQATVGPPILDGAGFTVTKLVSKQPPGNV